MQENPFLKPYTTPFETPPFHVIRNEHFLPALEEALKEARSEVEAIAGSSEGPTFENTIVDLEKSGARLDRISSVLFNLNAAETTDDLQGIAQEASPRLTAFNNEVKQNPLLFARIKTVYEQRGSLELNDEQQMLLEKTYKSFVRSGAGLGEADKKRFGEIAIALSQKGLSFGENVLAETNDYYLQITEEKDLGGLPADVVTRAKDEAKSRGVEGWAFTLQAPSYIPFMEYADNRALREQLFRAYASKATPGKSRDNSVLVKEIITLRGELAKLLGYENYADYILEERMAERPEKVTAFLGDLLDAAMDAAREEVSEIQAFMKEEGADFELQRWDWSYYSEKLRKKKFNLDDEIIKPYFRLENVIEGVFKTAEKLYGITFKKNPEIPVYHTDAMAYEVLEGDEVKAIFLADFFPRKGKRPGAWMTSFREQHYAEGKRVIPIVSIVCNFTPSSEGNPSLLKFDEVKTLFHEFGHALHGMLADTQYKSLSGTSVYWDFVELPSQIFENWCYEKECLDLFARHHKSEQPIPQILIDQIRASANYHEAYATVRQISFGLLDMAYHYQPTDELGKIEDVEAFEKEAMGPTELFPSVQGACMSVQFSHIFAGGYAAGYYSYKWAEVLDADAFSLFKANGVFDSATAASFKANILSQGGVAHPMTLYKRFRGQEPTPDALLRRAGLKE